MITQGIENQSIWFIEDGEVLGGRLVRIYPDEAGSGASGIRVILHRANRLEHPCPLDTVAERVFAENDYKAAKAAAEVC